MHLVRSTNATSSDNCVLAREGIDNLKAVSGIACDPLFYKAFSLCQLGRDSMSNYISKEVDRFYETKPKRSKKQVKRFIPGN